MAARHEAGHALMVLLEDLPIWEYDVTGTELIHSRDEKAIIQLNGSVVCGHDNEDESPETAFRVAIAGPAAEPTLRRLTPTDQASQKNDYIRAEEALRILAQQNEADLSSRRIRSIIHRNHRTLHSLFSKDTPYAKSVDVLRSYMLHNGKEDKPGISNRMLTTLRKEDIDTVVMAQMREYIATTINPKKDVQEKWSKWLRWLPT